MKKTFVFTLATILTLPAFAATNMYGEYGADTGKTVDAVATGEKTSVVKSDVKNTNVKNSMVENESVENLESEPFVADASSTAVMPDESVNMKSYSSNTTSSNPDIKFPRGLQFGAGVSATGGLDGFVGYNNKKFDSFWWKRLGVRLGYASTKPFKSFINKTIDRQMGDGIDIGDHLTVSDGELTAKHMFAMIDIYPFGDTWFLGGWRLSGGYYNGSLKATTDLTSKNENLIAPGTEFKLGNTLYKYVGGDAKGQAYADWNFKGPYAGLGFDLGLFSGLKIYFDAGVVFTDTTAKLNLEINDVSALQQSTNNGATWTAVNIPDLNTNKVIALTDAQKTLDKYPYYPIVKLGLMYRF